MNSGMSPTAAKSAQLPSTHSMAFMALKRHTAGSEERSIERMARPRYHRRSRRRWRTARKTQHALREKRIAREYNTASPWREDSYQGKYTTHGRFRKTDASASPQPFARRTAFA